MDWRPLLALALLSCVEVKGADAPDAREDEQTVLMVLNDGSNTRALVFRASDPWNAPAALAPKRPVQVVVAYFSGTIESLGWSAGPQTLVPNGPYPLVRQAPARIQAAVWEEGVDPEWTEVSALPGFVQALRVSERIQRACSLEAAQVVRLPPGNEVGHVAVLLPFDQDRLLVASGKGRRYFARPGNLIEISSSATATVADYSAGFADPLGRLWLVGYGMFLHRIDPPDPTEVEVIPTSSTTPVTPVYLDGGLIEGRLELFAIAPYPAPAWAPPERGQKLFRWREGEPGWTGFDLDPEYFQCGRSILCDAWKVTWIGPGRALLTGRKPYLQRFDDGRLERIDLPGCTSYSSAIRRKNGNVLVACTAISGPETLVELDADLQPVQVLSGIDPVRIRRLTYSMLEIDGEILLGASEGGIAVQGSPECPVLTLGPDDVAAMVPQGGAFAARFFKFDDRGVGDTVDQYSVRWFELSFGL